MMAPSAVAPPTTFAVRAPRELLARETSAVVVSMIWPLMVMSVKRQSQDGFSFKLAGLLSSTSFTSASAPRGITVWPFTRTGSSTLARNVCPRCATLESTASIMRTVIGVPAGIWMPATGWEEGAAAVAKSLDCAAWIGGRGGGGAFAGSVAPEVGAAARPNANLR